MRNLIKVAGLLALCALTATCTAAGTGGSGGSGGTTTGTDTTSSGGGDTTKNKATVTTTGDDNSKGSVDVDKSASKSDTEGSGNKVGASNAGSQLVLWITSVSADGNTKVIEVHINTEKYPLPATGIPAGEANSDAWVVYNAAGPAATGVYTSKGTGTIDITSCPAKSGQAVTGKFNGVLADGGAAVAIGPKSMTLDGAFNLVYFGTDGSVQCKPTTTGGTDAGGSVDVGSLKPPAGSTCDANPCDGGSNTTRNCCPYLPCVQPCLFKCANDMNACAQGCMSDPMNAGTCVMNCAKQLMTCDQACLTTCKVSATCNTAANAYFDCENKNMDACSQTDNEDSCLADKCCAEIKAAF